MKIGIIGTGLIGANLARKWVAAGHSVRIANDFDPVRLTIWPTGPVRRLCVSQTL